MAQYFKVYDWTGGIGLTSDERLVYSLILHFTENGQGFFAGYKGLSERLGIIKPVCKAATDHLLEIGAITESAETIFRRTRKVFRATKFFVDQYQDMY